jgi:hypothetical protein
MKEVVMKEVVKLLDAGIIYPISDSKWVSPIQVVPKKSSITILENEKGELVPQRMTIGWRVCIDYLKLNSVTRKDHFPLPFIDQILERLAGQSFNCFLDILDIIKCPLIRMIKKKLLSLVHMALLPIGGCPLACAMHLPPFKGA